MKQKKYCGKTCALAGLALLFAGNSLAGTSPSTTKPFAEQLAAAAFQRTHQKIRYDGAYLSIPYPGGDVPETIGVCTDVVIRSYRALGLDLQQLVHEDMKDNFLAYPNIWGLQKPDTNIDHRRVPNLQTFFERNGQSLTLENIRDIQPEPGDIISWMLPGNKPHIGIVSNRKSSNSNRLMLVHNIGSGPKLEDVMFSWPITGHYRFYPANGNISAAANPP